MGSITGFSQDMLEFAVRRALGKPCTQRNKDQAIGNKGDLEPLPPKDYLFS